MINASSETEGGPRVVAYDGMDGREVVAKVVDAKPS